MGVLVSLRERRPAGNAATPGPAGNGRTGKAAPARAGGGGSGPLLEARNLVQEFVVRDYGGVRGGVVADWQFVICDLQSY